MTAAGSGRVGLVIVGHVGLSVDRSPYGTAVTPGGAGYGCARGASVVGREVGLVAAIGEDLAVEQLDRLGVDLSGIRGGPGRSARFFMDQHPNGERMFRADFGIAGSAAISCFPESYAAAGHVHLATASPVQQLEWIRFLRRLPGRPTISVDMFEHFARALPAESRETCRLADMVFLNEDEQAVLFGSCRPGAPVVLVKRGPRGAVLQYGDEIDVATTTTVPAVDTTGAGEVLAGVFLGLTKVAGMAPAQALPLAVRAATTKVTEFGVDGTNLDRELRRIRQVLAAPAGAGSPGSGRPSARG